MYADDSTQGRTKHVSHVIPIASFLMLSSRWLGFSSILQGGQDGSHWITGERDADSAPTAMLSGGVAVDL